MIKLRGSSLTLLAIALIGFASCGRTPRPDTPQAFVDAMRHAYERKNVDVIMALTADPTLPPFGNARSRRNSGDERYDRERDRKETEIELQRNGMWYRAGKNTRFVSSREHGDHLHVTVTAMNVPTEVVLVRQDGVLKIHPEPGSFD
jgi:hypothetical protein